SAEAVGDGLGDLALAGDSGALLAQPSLQCDHERPAALVAHAQALLRRQAVDLALHGEQGVYPLDRRDGDRRLGEPGEIEELAPRVRPARRLDDWTRFAARSVEPGEARIGVRLHQPSVTGQMLFRMFGAAIGRVEEHGSRRVATAKRPVIAHIGPYPSGA